MVVSPKMSRLEAAEILREKQRRADAIKRAEQQAADAVMFEDSELYGPFTTDEERDQAIVDDMAERDVEGCGIINLTKLKIENGQLVRELSYIEDGTSSEEEEDEDDE
jgi:hypothetical protein